MGAIAINEIYKYIQEEKNHLGTINFMKVNTSGLLLIEIPNVKYLFNLVFKASFDSFK